MRFDGLRFTVFEVEFPRDFRGCVKSRDTTGFSRVEFQFLTNKNRLADAETTDFSRVEFRFLPNATLPPKGRN